MAAGQNQLVIRVPDALKAIGHRHQDRKDGTHIIHVGDSFGINLHEGHQKEAQNAEYQHGTQMNPFFKGMEEAVELPGISPGLQLAELRLNAVGDGGKDPPDAGDHHKINRIDGDLAEGGEHAEQDDIRVFQHKVGDVLGDPVPFLRDGFLRIPDFPVDRIMSARIQQHQPDPDDAQQGSRQPDCDQRIPRTDHDDLQCRAQQRENRAKAIEHISLLIGNDQQGFRRSGQIMGHGSQPQHSNQPRGGGDPRRERKDRQQQKNIDSADGSDSAKHPVSGRQDRTDLPKIPVRQRPVQRGRNHGADSQFQQNGIGKKLGDGMRHAVQLRAIVRQNLPGKDQAAQDRRQMLQHREQRVFRLRAHLPVTFHTRFRSGL